MLYLPPLFSNVPYGLQAVVKTKGFFKKETRITLSTKALETMSNAPGRMVEDPLSLFSGVSVGDPFVPKERRVLRKVKTVRK